MVKEPLGAAIVPPTCVVAEKELLVPVYHNFAFDISDAGAVVPVVLNEKLDADIELQALELAVTTCTPITCAFDVAGSTLEEFCVVVLEE